MGGARGGGGGERARARERRKSARARDGNDRVIGLWSHSVWRGVRTAVLPAVRGAAAYERGKQKQLFSLRVLTSCMCRVMHVCFCACVCSR